ncbi:MAG: 50S ribosomal protein L15 [Deltaproteobacteria bacterium]|nr:50S ribosomal protein L15 [Deltaproteobacteria bacterium]MCL5791690.1 50S ribosomal protein L15 [Deltaproteobacteria bacterium]
MNLSTLKKPDGMIKERKRIGRGTGSCHGKTAGKGHKGHNARAGGGVKPDFEGGQMPLKRRMPKYGFVNPNHIGYQVVNIESLNIFDVDEEITLERMIDKGIIRGNRPVVVLGNGEIKKKLFIKAHRFSGSAKEKIEIAGGKAEVVKIAR